MNLSTVLLVGASVAVGCAAQPSTFGAGTSEGVDAGGPTTEASGPPQRTGDDDANLGAAAPEASEPSMSVPLDATTSVDSGGPAASDDDASPPHVGDGGPCPAPPPNLDAQAAASIQLENQVRSAMGSPCATMVPTLNTASAKHCAYYDANQSNMMCVSDPHTEVSSCSMYTSANFWDRDTAAGYSGQAAFEDMAFIGNGKVATQALIDTVWHRTPILSPWVDDVGYGSATGCDTMDFGVGAGAQVSGDLIVSYPYDGQTGVPRTFDGNEGPAPPAPPNGFPSGYIVHVFIHNATLTTHEFSVDGGAQLSHQWITPATSQYAQDVDILYGDAPLSAATRYRVHVAGTRMNGQAVDVSFAFTTQ